MSTEQNGVADALHPGYVSPPDVVERAKLRLVTEALTLLALERIEASDVIVAGTSPELHVVVGTAERIAKWFTPAALARAGIAADTGQKEASAGEGFDIEVQHLHRIVNDAAVSLRNYGRMRLAEKLEDAAARVSNLAAPTAAQDGWISVEDRLPEHECLAVYVTPNGKQRLIRAKYARQFQIEAGGDDDCRVEYNEDDDTYYIEAGWLECIDNWGEYSSCYVTEGTVTHWKPSPALPAIAAQPKDTTGTKEKANG